jgi:hypothetical protein
MALAPLGAPTIDDDEARDAWERLQALMELDPTQMSVESREEYARQRWMVFAYTTEFPK